MSLEDVTVPTKSGVSKYFQKSAKSAGTRTKSKLDKMKRKWRESAVIAMFKEIISQTGKVILKLMLINNV